MWAGTTLPREGGGMCRIKSEEGVLYALAFALIYVSKHRILSCLYNNGCAIKLKSNRKRMMYKGRLFPIRSYLFLLLSFPHRGGPLPFIYTSIAYNQTPVEHCLDALEAITVTNRTPLGIRHFRNRSEFRICNFDSACLRERCGIFWGGVVGVGVIVMCWDRNFVGLLDWIEVERFRERE